MKWISVKERLPDLSGRYLVYPDNLILYWDKEYIDGPTWTHPWCCSCFEEVTHWMPLPNPPLDEAAIAFLKNSKKIIEHFSDLKMAQDFKKIIEDNLPGILDELD